MSTLHLPVLWHALLCSLQKVWRLAVKHKEEAVGIDGNLHEGDAIILVGQIENMTAQLRLQRHGQQAHSDICNVAKLENESHTAHNSASPRHCSEAFQTAPNRQLQS